jgi:exodeoxyribonuclease VII small subunit
MSDETTVTYEKAFARLEEILEKMNSGSLSLDSSIALYEEADSLIHLCNKRLSQAETKIEMLVKNREGDLQLNANGSVQTETFSSSSPSLQG